MSDDISEQTWKVLTPEELEREYHPSKWSKRYPEDELLDVHIRITQKTTDAAKAAVQHRCGVRYNDAPNAVLDVYGEDLPSDSAIVMYVHGGYWQWVDGGRHVSASMVEPLYQRAIITVVIGYDIAPQVGVSDIVVEVAAAVKWVCSFARRRGSKGVVLAGWSAGGHLITQVVSKACESGIGLDDLSVLRALVTLAGVFDLRPLVHTDINDPLNLNTESAWQLSPLRLAGSLGKKWVAGTLKLLALVGQHESNEFKRQSKQYCQVCVSGGMEGRVVELEDTDHFNIIENLNNPQCHLTTTFIKFIQDCTQQRGEK